MMGIYIPSPGERVRWFALSGREIHGIVVKIVHAGEFKAVSRRELKDLAAQGLLPKRCITDTYEFSVARAKSTKVLIATVDDRFGKFPEAQIVSIPRFKLSPSDLALDTEYMISLERRWRQRKLKTGGKRGRKR